MKLCIKLQDFLQDARYVFKWFMERLLGLVFGR